MQQQAQNAEPECIMLMGLQAAGKSTLYQTRWVDTHVRINRDMLRTTHRMESLLFACLRTSQSFVLDNTQVHRAGRRRYLSLARAAGFVTHGYVFEPDLAACLERNRKRARSVPEAAIRGTHAKWELPAFDEGFTQLFVVRLTSDDPSNPTFDIIPLTPQEQSNGQK